MNNLNPNSTPNSNLPIMDTALSPSQSTEHKIDIITAYQHVTEAKTALEGLELAHMPAHEPNSHGAYLQLQEVRGEIAAARSAIGDPNASIPIHRRPNPNPIDFRSIATVPPSTSFPAPAPPPSTPTNPTLFTSPGSLANTSFPVIPAAPPSSTSSIALSVSNALSHLNVAAEILNPEMRQAEIPSFELERANSELRAADAFVKGAMSLLQLSNPGTDFRPPQPPIHGGPDDLFPGLRGMN